MHIEKQELDMFLEVQKLVEVTEYLKHIESVYLVDILEIYFLKKNFKARLNLLNNYLDNIINALLN